MAVDDHQTDSRTLRGEGTGRVEGAQGGKKGKEEPCKEKKGEGETTLNKKRKELQKTTTTMRDMGYDPRRTQAEKRPEVPFEGWEKKGCAKNVPHEVRH